MRYILKIPQLLRDDASRFIKYPFRSEDIKYAPKYHVCLHKHGDGNSLIIPKLIPEKLRYISEFVSNRTSRLIVRESFINWMLNKYGIKRKEINNAMIRFGLIQESGYPINYPDNDMLSMSVNALQIGRDETGDFVANTLFNFPEVAGDNDKTVPFQIAAMMFSFASPSASGQYVKMYRGGDKNTFNIKHSTIENDDIMTTILTDDGVKVDVKYCKRPASFGITIDIQYISTVPA